jgi:ribosomal 50S subunit-recycling heat shock protein
MRSRPEIYNKIRFGQKTTRVEVVSVAEHAAKDEAAAMYKEIR